MFSPKYGSLRGTWEEDGLAFPTQVFRRKPRGEKERNSDVKFSLGKRLLCAPACFMLVFHWSYYMLISCTCLEIRYSCVMLFHLISLFLTLASGISLKLLGCSNLSQHRARDFFFFFGSLPVSKL